MSFINRFKSKDYASSQTTELDASDNHRRKTEFFNHPVEQPFSLNKDMQASFNTLFYHQIFKTPLNDQALSNDMKLALDQLAAQLLKNNEFREKATPRMPAVLPQLMKCLKDENANKNQFVELIKQDAAIAAAVLKSANSVLYNPSGRKIDSFNRAVVILGVGGLKSIVCTAMLKPVSRTKSGNEELTKQLWAHSLRTGIAAQLMSKQYAQDPFIAYLVGLFHSIGALTLNTQLNLWGFKNMREEANSFMYLKKQCSEQLTLAIIKQWELPEDIQKAMANQMNNEDHQLLSHAASLSHLIALHEQDKINDAELEEHLEAFAVNSSFTEQVATITHETLNT